MGHGEGSCVPGEGHIVPAGHERQWAAPGALLYVPGLHGTSNGAPMGQLCPLGQT